MGYCKMGAQKINLKLQDVKVIVSLTKVLKRERVSQDGKGWKGGRKERGNGFSDVKR